MPHETYLERKLRQLGLTQDHPPSSNASTKRLTFRLYFPRPPYGPVQYSAAKQGDGLNFVGQLLGHGGCTLKKIQTDSGARVEVHDGKGNLNGTHPSYTDPTLHAVVFADSREKLNKAAQMIAEVLQPLDVPFERFEVLPGGSALLKPSLPQSKKEKNTSPRSEASSRSHAVRWGAAGGASTPSSENDSLPSHQPDIDSAYVEKHQPWRSLKGHSTQAASQTCDVTAETVTSGGGWREWDTWGRHNSEGYNQFTALTQNLVSQCARSRQLKRQNWEQQYYSTEYGRESGIAFGLNSSTALWRSAQQLPSPAAAAALKINGANVNSSFAQFSLNNNNHQHQHQQHEAELPNSGIWKSTEMKSDGGGYPFEHVYEDLIGGGSNCHDVTAVSSTGVQGSRLMNAYQIPMMSTAVATDSEMQQHYALSAAEWKRRQQHIALPHEL